MYITYTLIALNILSYFLALHVNHSDVIFGLDGLFLGQSYYWQPLTSMFMHGDLTHLSMDMVVLYQFGYLLEKARGWKFFTVLYMIGGLLTSLLTFVFMYFFELSHIVVGASGALSVLFGYLSYKDKELRYGLIVAIVLISFVPNFFGMQIAWYAHFIGFGVGFLWGVLDKK